MLTLVLVAALCTSDGCGYMDATSKFREVKTDGDCIEVALALNLQNAALQQPTRFTCVPPSEFRRLVSSQAF